MIMMRLLYVLLILNAMLLGMIGAAVIILWGTVAGVFALTLLWLSLTVIGFVLYRIFLGSEQEEAGG